MIYQLYWLGKYATDKALEVVFGKRDPEMDEYVSTTVPTTPPPTGADLMAEDSYALCVCRHLHVRHDPPGRKCSRCDCSAFSRQEPLP